MNRRELLAGTTGALALAALARPATAAPAATALARAAARGLQPDPAGIIQLPAGFRYVVLSRGQEPMSDGVRTPGQPDGMACFPLEDGTWAVLRNHEIGDASWLRSVEARGFVDAKMQGFKTDDPRAFDPSALGGVSRLVIDPEQLDAALAAGNDGRSAVVTSHMVLAGTSLNCSGGVCSRGWITCEETDTDGHGWAFVVHPDDDQLVDARARRLAAWGRFKREGVAVFEDDGEVYMTEDHVRGAFYRFRSLTDDVWTGTGVLEALAVEGFPHSDRHLPDTPRRLARRPWQVGETKAATWVAIADPTATNTRCRDQARTAGATAFHRAEGIVATPDGRHVWIAASTAGPVQGGQLFRYDRDDHTMTLVAEVGSADLAEGRAVLSMPDNLAFAPDGSLLLCEDNYDAKNGCAAQHIRLRTAEGAVVDLARNQRSECYIQPTADRPSIDPEDHAPGAEFAGACFAPDGRTMFVNIQGPEHLTLAVRGPFQG